MAYSLVVRCLYRGIDRFFSVRGIHQQSNLQGITKFISPLLCVSQKFYYSTTPAVCQASPLLSICKQIIPTCTLLLQQPKQLINPSRSATKYSLVKGKAKTVKAVTNRFFRLNSGFWIRPMAGRAKRLHQKSGKRRYRLRQHVFCNARQCRMLDKMVTACWKRPRYYINDIYNPYHNRYNLPIKDWQ